MSIQRFLIALAFLPCLASMAHASPYSAVVVYGDSLSDNGNLFAATGFPGAPYYNGRRSDGPLAVEHLATSLGAPLVDLAWIGATTGVGNFGDNGSVTSFGFAGLPGMTTVYDTTRSTLGPLLSDGLFVVWGGANDLLAPSPLDAGDPLAIIDRAVNNLVAIISDLRALGAGTILAPGIPDLGLTPEFRSLGPVAAAQASAFTDAFNALLLASLPTDVLFFDTAALTRDVVANPAAYGLTNVTDACFDGVTQCSTPANYLYYDSFHPTTAADAIIARGFLATVAVPEPSSLALAVMGLALVAARRRFGFATL